MINRTLVFAAICGATAGIAMLLAVKNFVIDPYVTSKSHAEAVAQVNRQNTENLQRDQVVADSIEKLDARSKKPACEVYIGGLKEQNLPVSSIISKACSGE